VRVAEHCFLVQQTFLLWLQLASSLESWMASPCHCPPGGQHTGPQSQVWSVQVGVEWVDGLSRSLKSQYPLNSSRLIWSTLPTWPKAVVQGQMMHSTQLRRFLFQEILRTAVWQAYRSQQQTWGARAHLLRPRPP
jgi:hypothetical protein